MENILELHQVSKTYSKSDFTLDSLSLSLPYGAILGFVGENGAGKTTTIDCILNTVRKDSGTVKLFGREMGDEDTDIREKIGVVYDGDNFPGFWTATHLSRVMAGLYAQWDDALFQKYLEEFRLPPRQKIRSYSRGMTMKLALAAALSHHPQLLILDEATSGLDPVVRSEILDIFRELIEDGEHTIFISSHITSDIEKISDYVMLIHKGELLLSENKDDILYNYAIVRCTKQQASLIPEDIVVGREEGQYEVSVLVRDKRRLLENNFKEKAEQVSSGSFAIDRAGVEDVLLYIVKAKEA